MWSWHVLPRHLTLSGRKEVELAWDHVMNFDTCSWLRRQSYVVELILSCHFVLIKTSQDVNSGPSEIL